MSRSSQRRRRSSTKSRSRLQRFLLRYGWLLPVGAVILGSTILVLTYAFASLPLPRDVDYLESSAEVYDRQGRLIGTFSGEVRRFLIDTTELPKFIGRAVVAAEDRDFYEHGGVSLRGIARAAWANLTGGEIQQGGSTITQQYVKQAVLQDPSRTIARKVKEAILSIKLERRYSKKEILGFYLNTVYLGRGAYGVEAAARTYFDRHADELTLGQAAYLAGIIPSPESYQPDDNQLGAQDRRDRVLRILRERGQISARRARVAMRGKVRLRGDQNRTQRSPAAYFMEWIRKEFLYPEYKEQLYTGGLKIHTTLDLGMQQAAEEAVASTLTLPGDPQAALVSMTPRGEVRAFVGGRSYSKKQRRWIFTDVRKARGFNFASDVPGRQAGSAFKPFTLLAAIEDGISPSSTFSGASPRTISPPECDLVAPWQVDNYGGSSYGTMTLDSATTNSVNTVFAQLAAEVGPNNIVETLEKLGFDRGGRREIAENCSLALGVLDVTPVEMARAYATFAARGRLPDVNPIRYVEDSSGGCREFLPDPDVKCGREPKAESKQVVPQNSVDVLNQVLTHVVEGGTATAANIGRPVAGKTGTTQENRDAWFAGHIPQLATAVWMGYPAQSVKGRGTVVPDMRYCSDPVACRPVHGIEVTGGSFPAQIWAKYMGRAAENLDPVPFPVPTDVPDDVLNSPPPGGEFGPEPTNTRTAKPQPSQTQEPQPTQPPSPQPTQPSPQPTVIPSGTPRGGDDEDGNRSGKGKSGGRGGDP